MKLLFFGDVFGKLGESRGETDFTKRQGCGYQTFARNYRGI